MSLFQWSVCSVQAQSAAGVGCEPDHSLLYNTQFNLNLIYCCPGATACGVRPEVRGTRCAVRLAQSIKCVRYPGATLDGAGRRGSPYSWGRRNSSAGPGRGPRTT